MSDSRRRTVDALFVYPVRSSRESLRVDIVSQAVRYSFFLDAEPISLRISHMAVMMVMADADVPVVKKFDITYRVPPLGVEHLRVGEDIPSPSLVPVQALVRAFSLGTLV